MRFLPLLGFLIIVLITAVRAQDTEPVFPVSGFAIEGATLVPHTVLREAADAFTGTERRFADIERARAAVQQEYTARGYGAVQVVVPEQEITGGTVLLRVVEARLAAVEISGNTFHDEANIRRSLPQLREGESPNTVALSRSLAQANRSPSKQTVVSLGSSTRPGEIEARVVVQDEKPWRVTLGADNTGTEQTGTARVSANFRHANLWQRDHLFAAQYVTSPEHPSDVTILGMLYRLPLYRSGDSLQFLGSYSNVSSGSIAGFDVKGRGSMVSGRYTRNLNPRGAYQHALSFGLGLAEYRSDLSAGNGIEGLRSDITLRPATFGYEGAWRTQQRQAEGNMTLVQNLRGGRYGDRADFDANRQGADPGYTILRVNGSFTQVFDNNSSLTIRAGGQWTDDVLVPVEFFGVGGVGSVRGFHPREAGGDTGYLAGAEWFTPDLAPRFGMARSGLRLSWFLDAGSVKRKDPLPGETARRTLSSTGVGLRYNHDRSLQLRLDAARILDDGDLDPDDDYRLHASLSWSF